MSFAGIGSFLGAMFDRYAHENARTREGMRMLESGRYKTAADYQRGFEDWERAQQGKYMRAGERDRRASRSTTVHGGRKARNTVYLNEYYTSEQYGGPEEGGWYYTHYESGKTVKEFSKADRAKAVKMMNELERAAAKANKGLRYRTQSRKVYQIEDQPASVSRKNQRTPHYE